MLFRGDAWQSASSDVRKNGRPAEHLIVLANGILSSPEDWHYVKDQLLEESEESLLIYAEKDNVYLNTMRGIDVAGKRLAEGVLDVVKRNPSLKRISFIAHSLGGLFVRYCLALLYRPGEGGSKSGLTRSSKNKSQENEIEDDAGGQMDSAKGTHEEGGKQEATESQSGAATGQPAQPVGANLDEPDIRLTDSLCKKTQSRASIAGLEPVHLIFIAVPHLGVWGRRQWPFALGFHSAERVASFFSGMFLGRTLGQLFLRDRGPSEEPLLLSMSKDCEGRPFVSALSAFETRHMYANVMYDKALGWKTSCIRTDEELDRVRKVCVEKAERKQWLSERYPYIVYVEDTPPDKAYEESLRKLAVAEYAFAPPLKRQLSEALPKRKKRVEEKHRRFHKWSDEEACRALAARMIVGLHQVSWRKVDVLFHNAPGQKYAHQMLIMKSPEKEAAGEGVVNHIMDVLCNREQ